MRVEMRTHMYLVMRILYMRVLHVNRVIMRMPTLLQQIGSGHSVRSDATCGDSTS